MSALEARYRRLLRAYPDWYRQDRGEDMLGTLLEAAGPGRSRPTARDTRALILGGLRVRTRHGQLTGAESVRLAVLLAAVLTLALWTAFEFSMVRGAWGYTFPSMIYSWLSLVLGLLTLAAAAGAWFGRRAVAGFAAVACAGLWVYQPPGRQLAQAAAPVLALAVIAVLVIRQERLPRSWLWLAGTVLAEFLLPRVFPGTGPLGLVGNFGPFIILGATIAWSVVDARPMAGVALWLAVTFGADSLRSFAQEGVHIYLWGWWLPAIIATAVSIAAIWQSRRQAIL